MALVINTNVASLGAQRSLAKSTSALSLNVGRLSSGNRIMQAADDAAGLGISEKLKAQIRGLSQASRNANDGVSMIQIAEGAMNEQAGILTRLRELAIQSANGTLGVDERSFIDAEADQLVAEISRISLQTEFNGTFMLSATAAASMQIGVRAGDTIAINFTRTHSDTLGTGAGGAALTTIDLGTSAATATTALGVLDAAINDLSRSRSTVGAAQNRLNITVSNLAVAHENLSAANSRLRDVDVAEESAALTRNQILNQAGVALLAQANQLPGAALSLLGG